MFPRKATKLARRIVAVGALVVLAYPAGATAMVRWVADHDMIDVPYVRDCHGIYPHHAECHQAGHPSAFRHGPAAKP
jgi:hypothetical protein